MKLFQHSNGMTIAFGFDMINRRPDPFMISWNDPATGEWEMSAANHAGFVKLRVLVDPEFVHETRDSVVIYRPGLCTEMTYIGTPYIWQIRTMYPERDAASIAA